MQTSCDQTSFWSHFDVKRQPKSEIGSRDAIMIIDMQRDFADSSGALYVQDGELIVPAIERLVSFALHQQIKLYFTRDYHTRDHCSFQENGGRFPTHCLAGTTGSEIISSLSQIVRQYILTIQSPISVSVLFKGFTPTMDSFGSFIYDPEYAKERDLDHDGVDDDCDNSLTGSFALPVEHCQRDELDKIVDYNLNSNPEPDMLTVHSGARARDVMTNTRDLYLVGLAFDFCVIDTAITARLSGIFRNIYIVANMTLPILKDSESISKIQDKLVKYNVTLVELLCHDLVDL